MSFNFEQNLESVQEAYKIGYLLEDVRISFNKDFNASVSGVEIEAKEGDIISLPRWIVKILVSSAVVDLQDTDTSAYISRALNRERISRPHDLSAIDADFYVRARDYISDLTGKDNKERQRERENMVISLNTFISSRLEKIVKLAAASPLSPDLESKLSAEEKEMYLLIHNSCRNFKQRVLER